MSSRTVELVGIPPSGIGLNPISSPVGSDACNSAQPSSQAYWVNGGWPIGPLPMCLYAGLEVCSIEDVPVARAGQLVPITRDIEHIPEGLIKVPLVGDWGSVSRIIFYYHPNIIATHRVAITLLYIEQNVYGPLWVLGTI